MISCNVKPLTLKPSHILHQNDGKFYNVMRKFYSEKFTLVIKLCDFYLVICGAHKTKKSRDTLREKCPHPELL